MFIICLILCFVAFGSFIVYWLCKGMERRERIITVVKANVCVFGFFISFGAIYNFLDIPRGWLTVDAIVAFCVASVWVAIFVQWCENRPNSFIRRSRGRG
jgi:hypothetical protein